MTNTASLLMHTPLLAGAILLLSSLLRMKKTYFVKAFIFTYTMLIGWICSEMLFYILKDKQQLHFVFDLKLAFISFVAVALFLTITGFYRLNRIFPKWLVPVLLIIPAITTVLALTTTQHSLLRLSFSVIATGPLTLVTSERSLWFYVNMVYCELLMVVLTVIVFRYYRSLPRAHKKGSLFILICMCFYYGCTIIEMFWLDRGLPIATIDFNLIGASLGGVFCYIATISRGRLDFAYIEKRDVFDYLDDVIFILNAKDQLLDANVSARGLFRLLKEELGNESLSEFWNRLKKLGKIDYWTGEGGAQYISVLAASQPMFFKTQVRPFDYAKEQDAGKYVLLKNVTNEHLMIEQLQALAGVDVLTGIPNRYRYQQLLRELDVPKNLPLSIIIGDLNNLKETNDTHGHARGDALLKKAANILQENCPMGGYVARIGGDEFAMLLPNYMEWQTQVLIHAIKETAASYSDDLPLSIALGAATKSDESQNISSLIHAADLRMYDEKHNEKHHLPEGGGAT